jgi:hypothetical protein
MAAKEHPREVIRINAIAKPARRVLLQGIAENCFEIIASTSVLSVTGTSNSLETADFEGATDLIIVLLRPLISVL